ncbi:MAG TPA: amidohydrolase family protein [Chloroflexota bacterium]|nr:amidohydrolase family protein [Chloroflexota bacterium]
MAKQGFKVLDSDMHIMEPADLWERYTAPEFRDRAPRGRTDSVGDLTLTHPDGRLWGRATELEGFRSPRGKDFAFNQKRFKSDAERGWSAEVQLEAMDAEGIDIATIYPSRGLHALGEPEMDPELAAAVARAYNDWLHDFCRLDPTRLVGVGMISVFRIEDAMSESRRCVDELGFKGVFLRPNQIGERPWHDAYFDPLWSTLEELDVPLGFHEAIFTGLGQVGAQFGTNFMLRHTYCHSVEQMLAAGSFCGGGILERHPRLTVAFLEGNCGWLPWLLWRLDEHWEQRGDIDAAELKMPPSEYFKRQCYASVEADEEAVKYVIDFMGNDRIVFSTDYPHGDSKFPKSVERFLRLPIGDEDKRKILWDNCAAIYRLAA